MAGAYLASCSFYLSCSHANDLPIYEISGLSVECPPASGNKVLGSKSAGKRERLNVPTSEKYNNVTIKLAASADTSLFDWYRSCNNNDGGGSNVLANKDQVGIVAMDADDKEVAEWVLKEAYPIKYEGPSFKAADEELANETIELCHLGIERVR